MQNALLDLKLKLETDVIVNNEDAGTSLHVRLHHVP